MNPFFYTTLSSTFPSVAKQGGFAVTRIFAHAQKNFGAFGAVTFIFERFSENDNFVLFFSIFSPMFSQFSLKNRDLLHKYDFFLACSEVLGTFLQHFCISDSKNRTKFRFPNDGAAICRPQNEKRVDFAGSPIVSSKKSNTSSFYE